VANRDTLQISTFVDESPRGFGFLQRDRNFDHYQDDDQHFETRPSLWIEPIGDWSAGGFQLIEIPSDSEINHNIIAIGSRSRRLPPEVKHLSPTGSSGAGTRRSSRRWRSPSSRARDAVPHKNAAFCC